MTGSQFLFRSTLFSIQLEYSCAWWLLQSIRLIFLLHISMKVSMFDQIKCSFLSTLRNDPGEVADLISLLFDFRKNQKKMLKTKMDLTCSQWQWSVHMQVEVIEVVALCVRMACKYMFDSSFCFGQPASTPSWHVAAVPGGMLAVYTPYFPSSMSRNIHQIKKVCFIRHRFPENPRKMLKTKTI